MGCNILFSLAMLMSGITEVIRTEGGKEIMNLGYPIYVLTILGVAKILGAIALVQEKSGTLREWAYAGFTIDFIGASASGAYSGGNIGLIITPLIFLAVMFISYFLWKKAEQLNIA